MPSEPPSKTAYELLGVPRNAGVSAIRRAFRKMARRYHPHLVPLEEKTGADERFAPINQAHALLCDADKRRKYDALLDRGIIPDLAQEVGEVPQPALADIVGDIRALNLKANQERLLAGIDTKLREQLLLPALMTTGEIQETVVDVVRCDELPLSAGYNRPPGEIREAWVVVTELRLIVLLRILHKEYADSKTTYWRSCYFWYPAMTNMLVHEIGRASSSYYLELEDDQERHFILALVRPRLTRLFLVANTYHLPLKSRSSANFADELRPAMAVVLFLPLLWCIPFVSYFVLFLAACICDLVYGRRYGQANLFDPCDRIYNFLTTYGLTTIVVYLTPILLTYFFVRIVVDWKARSARDVFGTLTTDYTDDVPVVEDEQFVARKRFPVVAPAAVPTPPPSVTPASEGPVVVEVPDAVRDALNKAGRPGPPGPGQESAAPPSQAGPR